MSTAPAITLRPVDPEALARLFHEQYERLAPGHGYRTREASAKPSGCDTAGAWVGYPGGTWHWPGATCNH